MLRRTVQTTRHLARLVRLQRVHGWQDRRENGAALELGACLRLIQASLVETVALEEVRLLAEADGVRTILQSADLAETVRAALALSAREQDLVDP